MHGLTNAEGANPSALIQANDGNLYGAATYDGANSGGTIFRITPAGAFTKLYDFRYSDNPGALIRASDGNLYGMTEHGGRNYGSVFRFTLGGTLTTLYSFSGFSDTDGAYPSGLLAQGTDGNFYGVTGDSVFKITLGGAFTKLTNGANTVGGFGLVQATDGNFYGVTRDDTIFKIVPGGTLTTVYKASGGVTGFTRGADGNLYGTTHAGGANNDGTVFRLQLAPAAGSPPSIQSDGVVSATDFGPFPSIAPGT